MAGDASNKRRLPANVNSLEGVGQRAGFEVLYPQCHKRRARRNRGFPVSNRQDRIQNRDKIN